MTGAGAPNSAAAETVPAESAARPTRRGRRRFWIGLVVLLVAVIGAVALRSFRSGSDHLAAPAIRTTIEVGHAPAQLAVHGETAYVADSQGVLWFIDPTTRMIQGQTSLAAYGTNSTGLVVDEKTNSLVIAMNSGPTGLLVLLDLTTHQPTGTIALNGDFARALALDPTGRTAWVLTGSAAHPGVTIMAIDLDRRTVSGTIGLDGDAERLAVDTSDHRVYISGKDAITVIDGTSRTRIDAIPTSAVDIAVDPRSHMLYATSRDNAVAGTPRKFDAELKAIDPVTRSVTATVPTLELSSIVVVDDSDGTVYATSPFIVPTVDKSDPDACRGGWITTVVPSRDFAVNRLCIGQAELGKPDTVLSNALAAAVDPATHRLFALNGHDLLIISR